MFVTPTFTKSCMKYIKSLQTSKKIVSVAQGKMAEHLNRCILREEKKLMSMDRDMKKDT